MAPAEKTSKTIVILYWFMLVAGLADSQKMTIVNKCGFPVRVAIISSAESLPASTMGLTLEAGLITECVIDLNTQCPSEWKIMRDGEIMGCKNPCQDAQCSMLFKNPCPKVQVDVSDSSFACVSTTDYVITLCPSSSWTAPSKGEKAVQMENVVGFLEMFAIILTTISESIYNLISHRHKIWECLRGRRGGNME